MPRKAPAGWPANLTRLAIAAGGGWLALRLSGDLTYVFVSLAIALVAFGLINAAAVAGGVWFGPLRFRPAAWMRSKHALRVRAKPGVRPAALAAPEAT